MVKIDNEKPRMLVLQFVRAVQEAAEKDYEKACYRKLILSTGDAGLIEADREMDECERFFRTFYSPSETEILVARLKENAVRRRDGLPRLQRKHDRGISRRMRARAKETEHDT